MNFLGDLEGNGLVDELSCVDTNDRVSHLMDWLELAAAAPDDNTVLDRLMSPPCKNPARAGLLHGAFLQPS